MKKSQLSNMLRDDARKAARLVKHVKLSGLSYNKISKSKPECVVLKTDSTKLHTFPHFRKSHIVSKAKAFAESEKSCGCGSESIHNTHNDMQCWNS